MKTRIEPFLICFISVVLTLQVGGICFADNAARVELQVSYPAGKGYVSFYNGALTAIDASKRDYYVNVLVTLMDENNLPATAGPGGEDLSSLTATLTTDLGISESIVPDVFLSDTGVLHFSGGSLAVAHVKYACTTSCSVGDDTIEVVVGELSDSVEIEVRAPDASGVVIRTLRIPGAGPVELFDSIDPPSHNAGLEALAGDDIYFEIWAVEENGEFTFAPNLEGKEVTVNAYADYSGDSKINVVHPYTSYEPVSIAEAKVEFSDGKATGSLLITRAGTKDGSGNRAMRVVFTAITGVKDSAGDYIGTKQATVEINSDTDTDVDYVSMFPAIKSKLIIGKDPFAAGNLIEEVDYWYVLDDETQYSGGGPRTNQLAVFVADSYGNPVTGGTVTVSSTISSSLLAVGVTDETNGWNIAKSVRSDSGNDGLAIPWNNVRNQDVPEGGGPVGGTITLKDSGLLLQEDSATVYLVRTDSGNYDVAHPYTGANLLDLQVDTDKAGANVTAGETVTVYITDADGSYGNPTSQDIVEIGDSVTIHATKYYYAGKYYSGTAYLVSGNSQSYDQAVTTGYTHRISSSNVGSAGEIQIPIKIWGPCGPYDHDSEKRVIVSIADIKKGIGTFLDPDESTLWKYPAGDYYGAAAPQHDLENRWITEIIPAGETKIKITELASWVFAENSDLTTDPIVITSQFAVGENSFLTRDSVDTTDDYGNIYNDTPGYGVSSDIGVATTDSTRACTLIFEEADIGETGTVTVAISGSGTREFTILSVASSSPNAGATLVLEREGPPLPIIGGDAVVKLTADGITTASRQVKITLDTDNSVASAELKQMDGTVQDPLIDALEAGTPATKWVRFLVHAEEEGDVVVSAVDTSANPLTSASLTVKFYPPDDVAPTASINPPDGGFAQPAASIVITVNDNVGVYLARTEYNIAKGSTDITGSLECVAAGEGTTEGTITCRKSGGGLDLGSYLLSVTPEDLAGNEGTAVTSAFTVSTCVATVTVSPATASLLPGDTQQFTALTTLCGSAATGTYTWDIMTQGCTGSSIDATGLYTAPATITGTSCNDTVRAIDTANGSEYGTASVMVGGITTTTTTTPTEPLTVSPDPVRRSRWVVLPTLMVLQSDTANFGILQSKVTYSPANAVIKMPRMVLGKHSIWQLVLVNPPWLAGGATDDTLTVTVTTGAETVTGTTNIEMLPFGLDEQ